MADNHPLTVNFLPWLEVQEEIDIGPFRFWPFRKRANELVKDSHVRNYLEQVFATYVQPQPFPDQKGKTIPISELTVVTGDKYGFELPLEGALLNQATNALAFACIDSAGQWNWCTSDNFELVQLRFFPGDPNIGYQAGEIAQVKSYGWQLGEVLFQVPIYLNHHYIAKYDPDLISGLRFAVNNADRTEVQTILRALDYFTQACKNSGDVRCEMRIVLMALAFEVLLDLCEENPRRDFRPKIQGLCGDSSEPTQPYEIVDDRDGHVIATEVLTYKQIWAEEFYKLRNKIVHGRHFRTNDFLFNGQSHFRIAELFFRVCVRKRLEGIPGSNYQCMGGVRQGPTGEFEFDLWAL